MLEMTRWIKIHAVTWVPEGWVVAEVDTVVEGHHESVGIPTAPVSNGFQPHTRCKLQFSNNLHPIIYFSETEVRRWGRRYVRARIVYFILVRWSRWSKTGIVIMLILLTGKPM